jgi:hypothetical protein
VDGLRTWSVGTDGGVVTAECPEPLLSPSGPMPEWMSRCASALRDTLRELPIADGTVLEATLAGVPGGERDLGDALLSNVGVPESQVVAGVRLRHAPARGPGVVQTYRRVPLPPVPGEGDDETVLAALEVPIAGVYELDSARQVWLATRRVAVATLPPGSAGPPGATALRARLSTGTERELGNAQLIKKLLDGIRAAFQVYAGDDLEGTAQRLAAELRADQAELAAFLASPHGALLAPGERFVAADVIVVAGTRAQLEIELVTLQAGPS